MSKPYYQDEWATIYHGDCREILDSLEFDLVVTDPPYGISVAGSATEFNGRRNLDFFPLDRDKQATVEVAKEILSKCGASSIYAWMGHRQLGIVAELLEAVGYSTRFLVWEKECPPPSPPGAGWQSGAELCLYAYRPGRTWAHRDSGVLNVIKADSYRHGQPGKWPHPTQKPLAVIAPLIRASSREGDTVLDPFMGSGTTLRAAKDLGRKSIGIEIEERYCEIAAKRLAQGVLWEAS